MRKMMAPDPDGKTEGWVDTRPVSPSPRDRRLRAMQGYTAPPNGFPFSEEGLGHLEQQCFEASQIGDSALLEMAGLAIRRLREATQPSVDPTIQELQHRVNFLEQNETAVWVALQLPDGSTVHDVVAAIQQLRKAASVNA